MVSITRTDSSHPEFVKLVRLLDADLANRDGADHAFYAQFNSINKLNHVVITWYSGEAVGCGAMKEFDSHTVEIKRMYTRENHRGRGVALRVLHELETWALEQKYSRCVLETGKRQPEAIALYEKAGYCKIENYDQYKGIENSVCFEKVLLPIKT